MQTVAQMSESQLLALLMSGRRTSVPSWVPPAPWCWGRGMILLPSICGAG